MKRLAIALIVVCVAAQAAADTEAKQAAEDAAVAAQVAAEADAAATEAQQAEHLDHQPASDPGVDQQRPRPLGVAAEAG